MDIPIIREDDGAQLGYIAKNAGSWESKTIFGYVFSRSESRVQAEEIVREQGAHVLRGVWQYLDSDDRDWHSCLLQDVSQNQVVLIRTNDMGYQDPKTYKRVVMRNPDETKLIRA